MLFLQHIYCYSYLSSKKTNGCKKWWKSQARRMATEVSGKPLMGFQACLCGPWTKPRRWSDDELFRSNKLSCDKLELMILGTSWEMKSLRRRELSWEIIASWRQPKCRLIAWRAKPVYTLDDPSPAISSNDEITCSNWLQYLSNLSSTCWKTGGSKPDLTGEKVETQTKGKDYGIIRKKNIF